ncbi:MAG: hypothetical protein KDC33_03680 [Thermoleophilia bacterium]|nr:hypothetical protein [Thermoleophilia bacterium]
MAARRLGPAVAAALLKAGREWLADPANDAKKQALIAQVRGAGERMGGAPARLSAVILARLGTTRGGRAPAPRWGREVARLREHATGTPTGPQRVLLFDAYVEALHRAADAPGDVPAIADALAREAEAVVRAPLGPGERERALDALRGARGRLPHA